MKRIIFILIVIGFGLGLYLGVRSTLHVEEDEPVEPALLEESFQNELNLPLIEVDTFNPILTSNKQVSDTLKLVYEPLIDIDSSNKLSPALATDWMEKDELTWIVTLRDNVSWHSEKEFSANDVIFTINSLKRNDKAPYYNNVRNIVNVERLEDNAVSITLQEKDNLLPYKLVFPIVPEYYFKDSLENEEKANRPVGTGAYKYLETSDDGARMTLKRNNSWWNNKAGQLNTIYLYEYKTYGEAIKAFKSSEIDVINTSMTFWNKKFGTIGINNYQYENSHFETLIPNCQRTALSEPSVRRAILHAINRENIIADVYNGMASKQDIMIHNYSWVYDKELTADYNADKAKQLLGNALWKQEDNVWKKTINGRVVTLKFSLMVNKEDDEKIKVAEKIKEDLENIGIKITLGKVDAQTYQSNISLGKFDLAIGTIETNNEFDIIDLLGNNDYANYSGTALSENLNQLYLSNIYLETAFNDLQKNYKMEVPYIGLYYKTNMLLTNKSVKGSITPTWWNPYYNIYNWNK